MTYDLRKNSFKINFYGIELQFYEIELKNTTNIIDNILKALNYEI